MNTINGNYLFDDQLFTSIKYVETSDIQHFRTPKGARQLLTLAPVYNLKVGCTLHKTTYTHPVKAKSNYPISKVWLLAVRSSLRNDLFKTLGLRVHVEQLLTIKLV